MNGSVLIPSLRYKDAPAAIAWLDGRVTSPLYLIVKDCEQAYARALAAKAEVMMEIKTMEYGGKAFTVRDPEGYLWSVGEYSPWGEKETVTT